MTGGVSALAVAGGVVAGLALRAFSPHVFSWWFVAAAGLAAFFAVAAYRRRALWVEKSACVGISAVLVALPLLSESLWFLICAVLILAAYWWLLLLEQLKRERAR